MDVTPVAGRQIINGYGDGGFRIAGVLHRGSVLVFAERALPWPVTSMAELDEESLAEVRAARPGVELLLLGSGAKAEALPEPLRAHLRHAGIVAECMDTGAACRTFNVLLAENRRVAAALIALD